MQFHGTSVRGYIKELELVIVKEQLKEGGRGERAVMLLCHPSTHVRLSSYGRKYCVLKRKKARSFLSAALVMLQDDKQLSLRKLNLRKCEVKRNWTVRRDCVSGISFLELNRLWC